MFDITFTTGDYDFMREDSSVGINESYFIGCHTIEEGADWSVDIYELVPEYSEVDITVEYGLKTKNGWRYGGQIW